MGQISKGCGPIVFREAQAASVACAGPRHRRPTWSFPSLIEFTMEFRMIRARSSIQSICVAAQETIGRRVRRVASRLDSFRTVAAIGL